MQMQTLFGPDIACDESVGVISISLCLSFAINDTNEYVSLAFAAKPQSFTVREDISLILTRGEFTVRLEAKRHLG